MNIEETLILLKKSADFSGSELTKTEFATNTFTKARFCKDSFTTIVEYEKEGMERTQKEYSQTPRTGRKTVKVVPSPRVESTSMRPPCSPTIFLVTASPRPLPLLPLALKKA